MSDETTAWWQAAMPPTAASRALARSGYYDRPEPEPEPEADFTGMSMSEYAAAREASGYQVGDFQGIQAWRRPQRYISQHEPTELEQHAAERAAHGIRNVGSVGDPRQNALNAWRAANDNR
jgi:hypothetical protein